MLVSNNKVGYFMDKILDTALRVAIGFTMLLLLTRVIGKKQLGQLTIFTYITGMALGSIAGDTVINRDISIMDGVVGMAFWVALVLIVEFSSLKSTRFRIALDGQPTIIIKKGEIMQNVLRNHRLNIEDITMLLRTNNVFSISDVDYAILEANGQLSVLKKSEKQQLTRGDMNIPDKSIPYIPAEIIVDGSLIQKNLKELGLSYDWLQNELKKANIGSLKEVFYAEVQSDGSLYINRKI
jgi:uncharacterized membrane protein YcaP (DUF421 family)